MKPSTSKIPGPHYKLLLAEGVKPVRPRAKF